EASVTKLQPGHRFVVATPDAEVEVKGTRFELVVDGEASRCEPGIRTRLTVQEGVVAVRHGGSEVRVAAGSLWPACPPAPPPPVPPRAPPRAGGPPPLRTSARTSGRPPSTARAPIRRRCQSRTICSRRRSPPTAAATTARRFAGWIG